MKRYFKPSTILPSIFVLLYILAFGNDLGFAIYGVLNVINMDNTTYLIGESIKAVASLTLFIIGILFIIKIFINRDMEYGVKGSVFLIGMYMLSGAVFNVINFFESNLSNNNIYSYLIPAIFYVLMGFGWLSFIFMSRFNLKRSVRNSCILSLVIIVSEFVSNIMMGYAVFLMLDTLFMIVSLFVLFFMTKYISY